MADNVVPFTATGGSDVNATLPEVVVTAQRDPAPI
jgi:hypothetical protein